MADRGWSLGHPGLDAGVGLIPDAVHEAVFDETRQAGAALGFALALALRRLAAGDAGRPWLLCWSRRLLGQTGALSGHGLAGLGGDPGRVVLAAGRGDRDVLWTLEEAGRSAAVALAVGAVAEADLTATRRLSLVARDRGVTLLLVRHGTGLGPSAARSRWRVASAPSRPAGPGPRVPGERPCWRIAVEKGWRGRPQDWLVEWDHDTHRFYPVDPLADHAPGLGRAVAGGGAGGSRDPGGLGGPCAGAVVALFPAPAGDSAGASIGAVPIDAGGAPGGDLAAVPGAASDPANGAAGSGRGDAARGRGGGGGGGGRV
ncbi:hypothetical protein CCR80_00005 [Rhodothalassium salexigens]|uniref:hypothetical protein n=1 Tax=Rhodothalassium salexigens TaxID=1086 RepID=UPI001911FFF3|nr:hypothetical protein [Rhodothalassium salexigens]MBK5919424.1 hypothetical protein [Rhodothalassium salexigens]